jgi:hypothetical protein
MASLACAWRIRHQTLPSHRCLYVRILLLPVAQVQQRESSADSLNEEKIPFQKEKRKKEK